MNKTVCINPVDDEMELKAEMLNLLNKFKVLGFTKREAFVEMVMGESKAYHSFEGMKLLNNFWASRANHQELYEDLHVVYDNLIRG